MPKKSKKAKLKNLKNGKIYEGLGCDLSDCSQMIKSVLSQVWDVY